MSNDTDHPTDPPIVNLLIDAGAKTYEPLTLAALIERASRQLVIAMDAAVYFTPQGQHQFKAADGRWFELGYAIVPQALATPRCETCGEVLTAEEVQQAPAVDIFCRQCAWHHGGSDNQMALALT